MAWLVDSGERQVKACGRGIEIWEINPQEDEAVLSGGSPIFVITML